MKRYLSAGISLAMVISLTGCAPPSATTTSTTATTTTSVAGEGRPIIDVHPQTRPPFKTVTLKGEEDIEARGEIGQFGGVFRENQIGDGPKTFNPWVSADATSSAMGDAMFAGLVSTDAYTGEPIPYLAKDVKISDDKMTYTVTLRKGLKWSDGQPLTSKDVVFTWNSIIKPGLGNASTRDTVTVDGVFPEVKAVDDLTVVFKTAKPFAPFIRNLGTSIAPEHILKNVVSKGNDGFSAFWGVSDASSHPEKFVSSGMWVLQSYDPRARAIFRRNPHFFMVDKKGQRLPYFDGYSVSFVGDSNNQELQFEQGNADVYGVPGNFVSRMRSLKKPDYDIYNLGPTSSTVFMAFNLNPRKNEQGKPIVPPVKSKWFNDVNFRQAINHTINRNDMVANILKGVGAPSYTAESLSSIYLNPELAKGFDPDVAYAKSLLTKSGFTWDAQQKLHDKAGNIVEFTLYTNSGNNERENTGVNIQQDLKALGMKVNFKTIDFNVLGDKMHEGDWETMIMGLTGSNLEPHNGANVWKTDAFLHLFNQRVVKPNKPTDISDALPWEKELDSVFNRGSQVFGLDKRKAIYNEYQQIVSDQAPMVYLFSQLQIVAVLKRVHNLDPTPLGGVTHNLEELWVDPATATK